MTRDQQRRARQLSRWRKQWIAAGTMPSLDDLLKYHQVGIGLLVEVGGDVPGWIGAACDQWAKYIANGDWESTRALREVLWDFANDAQPRH